MDANAQKKAAAEAALQYVEDDMTVGVGTGSTVNFFIDALASKRARIKAAVASSEASAKRLREPRIPVAELNDTDGCDVYVDGADEVTEHLAMIKGGGGALTREKIVAAASRKFVCIADAGKLVGVLGKFPAAGGGDPDGAQLRRAPAGEAHRRRARAARGRDHRQRQPHPRRARAHDRETDGARGRHRPHRRRGRERHLRAPPRRRPAAARHRQGVRKIKRPK